MDIFSCLSASLFLCLILFPPFLCIYVYIIYIYFYVIYIYAVYIYVIYLSICLSIYQSINLSIYQSIYLICIYLNLHIYI